MVKFNQKVGENMGIEEADKICTELETYLTEHLRNCNVILYEIAVDYYSLIVESDLTRATYIDSLNITDIININKEKLLRKIKLVLGGLTYGR